jgi:hypothetical protein
MMEGKYGQLEKRKPDDIICIMFENFSNLRIFVLGKEKGMKIWQINKLMEEYNVDIMAGCKTRVDWRFTESTTNGFNSLIAQRQQRRGICAHSINKYVHQDQWGGTCMVAVRCLSTMTVATGVDSIGLGRWAWMHMGGGGKATRVLVAYCPCQPHCNIGSNTVWDQHCHHFEA